MSDDLNSRAAVLENQVKAHDKKLDDQAEELGRYASAAQKMALAKKDIAHQAENNTISLKTLQSEMKKRFDAMDETTAGIRRDRITLWTTVLVVVGGIITALITTLL